MTLQPQPPAAKYEEATRSYFEVLHKLSDERLSQADLTVRRQALVAAREAWYAAYAVLEESRKN